MTICQAKKLVNLWNKRHFLIFFPNQIWSLKFQTYRSFVTAADICFNFQPRRHRAVSCSTTTTAGTGHCISCSTWARFSTPARERRRKTTLTTSTRSPSARRCSPQSSSFRISASTASATASTWLTTTGRSWTGLPSPSATRWGQCKPESWQFAIVDLNTFNEWDKPRYLKHTW